MCVGLWSVPLPYSLLDRWFFEDLFSWIKKDFRLWVFTKKWWWGGVSNFKIGKFPGKIFPTIVNFFRIKLKLFQSEVFQFYHCRCYLVVLYILSIKNNAHNMASKNVQIKRWKVSIWLKQSKIRPFQWWWFSFSKSFSSKKVFFL